MNLKNPLWNNKSLRDNKNEKEKQRETRKNTKMSLCGARCFEPITKTDETVTCGGSCKVKFHTKCSSLTKAATDVLSKTSALTWRCIKCQTEDSLVTALLEKLRLQLAKFEKKNDENFAKIEKRFSGIETGMLEGEKQVRNDITKVVEQCSSNLAEQERWSEVVKKPRKKNSPVVHIAPKDKTIKSDATKAAVRNALDAADFSVQGMISASNGSVLIACDDDNNCSNLVAQAVSKLGDEFVVKKPHKRLPRVKLLRVVKASENNDEFLAELKKNNQIIGDKVEIVKREDVKIKGLKIDGLSNIVLQVDGETHKKIMAKGNLFVGWSATKVVDNIYIRRCYKCYGFNHNAADCKRAAACSRCGSEEHKFIECKSMIENCINCISKNNNLKTRLDVNHNVWSRECPVYMKKLAISKRGIEYID